MILRMLFVLIGALLMSVTPLQADVIEKTEILAASDPEDETSPALAEDPDGSLVVYTLLDPGDPFGPSAIAYQRLTDTGISGLPVIVSNSDNSDALPDASGSLIVYTSTFPGTAISQVKAFDTQAGTTLPISDLGNIRDVRVHGENIVWVEVIFAGSVVRRTTRAKVLAGLPSDLIAGPVPPARGIEVGSRFIVWDEDNVDGVQDVRAYDLVNNQHLTVTDNSNLDQGDPATSGDWVTWVVRSAIDPQGPTAIVVRNLSTNEAHEVVDNERENFNPSIDGDVIAYEGEDVDGDMEVYLYRLSTDKTFAITDDTDNTIDQRARLVNVLADRVAYIDQRNGNSDVFVSVFSFLADGDNDGVPDEDDVCPFENATGLDANEDGCIDDVAGLSELVSQLVDEEIIDTDMEKSLLQKVAIAESTTDKDQICAAVNQLKAFQKQVAAQSGNKISEEGAGLVLDYTSNAIIDLQNQLPAGEECTGV